MISLYVFIQCCIIHFRSLLLPVFILVHSEGTLGNTTFLSRMYSLLCVINKERKVFFNNNNKKKIQIFFNKKNKQKMNVEIVKAKIIEYIYTYLG